MHRADESMRSDDDSPRAGLLSPLRAFLLLAVVLAAAGLLLSMNRPDPAPPAETEPRAEPDYSLTNAEALSRFRELHSLARLAYSNADESLIALITTSDSPLKASVLDDLRQLNRDRVTYKPRIQERSLKLIENSPTSITLRLTVHEKPMFFDNRGLRITDSGRPFVQTVDWTLRPEGQQWKIYETHVVRTKPRP